VTAEPDAEPGPPPGPIGEGDEPDEVGVGPYPAPWPADPWLDPELLAQGDRRNVADRYRYWRNDAIIADLDRRRHPFHVAIENWQHDRNIGTIVRAANAFLAAEVHIVAVGGGTAGHGTDRYQHICHHRASRPAAGRTPRRSSSPGPTCPGSSSRPRAARAVRAGARSEGPARLTPCARRARVSIAQFGSTCSINAGGRGIAMHEWIRQHADVALGDLVAERLRPPGRRPPP
jgi:hypothetical protein